eukprot:5503837-Prymnesium_polylepis.1
METEHGVRAQLQTSTARFLQTRALFRGACIPPTCPAPPARSALNAMMEDHKLPQDIRMRAHVLHPQQAADPSAVAHFADCELPLGEPDRGCALPHLEVHFGRDLVAQGL